MNKPKIIAVVDNKGWCWTNTVRELLPHLYDFDIKIMRSDEYFNTVTPDCCDLVWGRGYSYTLCKPELKMPPFIFSVTTGNKLLNDQINKCKPTAHLAWGIICQNNYALGKLNYANYDKVWMIPNGVNTTLFKPFKTHGMSVGYAGNDERAELKGVHHVIEACKILRLPYTETTTINSDTGSVTPYNKMPQFYNSLFAYAQPSEAEGCSNSVSEAMACGKPVLICEGVGYHGEVCRDGINDSQGNVVFVKRDGQDIADKLAILVHNPHIYDRISKNARTFALMHDWKYVANMYRNVFNLFFEEHPIELIPEQPIELIPEPKQEEQNFFVNPYVDIKVKTSLLYRGKVYLKGDELPVTRNYLENFTNDEYEEIIK